MTVTALTTRVARVCVHPNGALVVRVATGYSLRSGAGWVLFCWRWGWGVRGAM